MYSVRVFVYGTLKTGEHNCESFLSGRDDCKFIGSFKTTPNYRLFSTSQHMFPYLICTDSKGCTFEGVNVEGEVWEVSVDALLNLDRLEGCPNHYGRMYITLDNYTGPKVQSYYTDWEAVNHMEYSGARWPFTESNRHRCTTSSDFWYNTMKKETADHIELVESI